MSDDPYGALDQPEEPQTAAALPDPAPAPVVNHPPAQPQSLTPPTAAAPARMAIPQDGLGHPAAEPLGYQYQDANTSYGYGPPPEQGAYGVPFYGQPTTPYPPMVAQPFYGRPLLEDPTASDAPLRGAGPVEAYKRFWQRGVTFTGRASLSEFWWVTLIHSVGFGGFIASTAIFADTRMSALVGLVGAIYMLAMFIPTIALSTRRLHDTGQSGLLQLLNLIPYLGGLITLILMAQGPKEVGKRYDRINQR